jgi:MFS transporter, DHA1 family, inner membrane transport protein
MPLALLALALGAFGIGTTEFVAIGLLPDVAASFQVSVPAAGWIVTGYALGVLGGAPLMAALGTRVPRKQMLLLLMGIFVLGNLVTALAPSYGVLIVGRLITSLTHGAFFGIGAIVAAELVGAARQARAIATMFTGLTLANLVGVPLGTSIGNALSWRATFGLVALLGLVGAAGVVALVPHLPRPEVVSLRREARALGDLQVVLAMVMTVLGFGGVFAAITYLSPALTSVAGFSDGAITAVLAVLGLGMIAGNLLGGRFADRALMPMLITTLAGLIVALVVFVAALHSAPAAVIDVFLIGTLGFATVPPLQKRVLDHAAAAPTLASALNVGAFNLGNALAAFLAGRTIAGGLGYASADWVGAAMAAGGLLTALLALTLQRRATSPLRATSQRFDLT